MKVTKNCFEWPFKMEIVNTLEYTFVYHYFEINFNIKRVILIHLLRTFLTPVAVLRIAFTPPTPPQKRMKNVAKKLNWVLLNVTSKIQTKSIRPMECTLNDCFCHQKAKINFTQSMGFAEGLYAITNTLHIAQLCLPLSWNRSCLFL